MEKQEAIEVPKHIKKILLDDEEVLASIRQSRFKEMTTPDTIIITNHRIIRYSPSTLGLRKEIEDYRYQDIANFKVKKGIMLATIEITPRFMSDTIILDNLPKSRIDYISRVVQENIRLTHSPDERQRLDSASSEDPLKIIKLRFARGEITREQYEEMKAALE